MCGPLQGTINELFIIAFYVKKLKLFYSKHAVTISTIVLFKIKRNAVL